MPGTSLFLAAIIAAAALGGCKPHASTASGPESAHDSAPQVIIQEVMAKPLTAQSGILWELAGNLYDDSGNLDAAQLDGGQWNTLQTTAAEMRQIALSLGEPSRLKVVADGGKIQSEGTPGALGAAEVQALIDAEPAAFTAEARKLADIAGEFVTAAAARDAQAVDELSGQLNEACSACHLRFWYPGQAAQ